ncbi:MAG: CHASE2 domain-containing protein [Planctomycetes bacterium]|nr:CHASE2 domain-containing protein [Planctomycetota bacterium]
MTRTERQLLFKTSLLSAGLIVFVVAAQWGGLLTALERWLYDMRVRRCQYFMPPPTDRLVHLDIDDPTLETVGRWPWDRAVLAQMTDELGAAGAKAIAFDVFFPEPQTGRWAPAQPGGDTGFTRVNDDAIFAQSLTRYGRALVAVSFKPDEAMPPVRRAAASILSQDLEMSLPEVRARLGEPGVLGDRAGEPIVADAWTNADLDDNEFLAARRVAFFERISRLFDRGVDDFAAAQKILLPRTSATFTGSPLQRVMEDQWRRVASFHHLNRFSRPVDPGLPPMLAVQGDAPPVPVLSAAAGQTGFVDFLSETDGVVRSVPLWVEHRGRAFPQIGLALACMQMGVDPRSITLGPRSVTVPRPGREALVIPVRTIRSQSRRETVGFIMDVPWFGRSQWETMYDAPRFAAPAQHVPLSRVWGVVQMHDNLRRNNTSGDAAVKALLYVLDQKQLAAFEAKHLDADDAAARRPIIEGALRDADAMGFYESYSAIPAGQLKPDEAVVLNSIRALRVIPAENDKLVQQIEAQRSVLRSLVSGRSVLIGHTASGTLDVINTPVFARCPGVIAHGAIFNAILTGEAWSRAPQWVDLAVTVGVGVAATLCIVSFSPFAGLLMAVVLAAGYLAVNGLLLFDYGNVVVNAAGPLSVIALVWSGATLHRFITERRERARITGRFRSYVDPALVSYVVEHPDEARLDGQVREMTVVFTDLAGFTTLSEHLREKTVEILNEYMGLMVPVITQHHGFVNKFLGDGIMFFFGAPSPNPAHAADAILAVMSMQAVLPEFNRSLEARGLPPVSMRAGINTGTMIVGDAGGAERSDYTVLGDAVNLAARLETANKAVGSRMMVTRRTVELAGADRFLFRPIGRLQVVGKTEGVMTYEPLGEALRATDKDRQSVERSRAVVDRFLAGDFRACLGAVTEYEAVIGADKFTATYRELCGQYIAKPPENFNGAIILTEK